MSKERKGRTCAGCGQSLEGRAPSARTCSATCRQRVRYRRQRGQLPPAEERGRSEKRARRVAAVDDGSPGLPALVDAVHRELEQAGKVDTVLGQQALALALRVLSPVDTGSAVASVSRELRAVMAAVVEDAGETGDALDELASRRASRAASA